SVVEIKNSHQIGKVIEIKKDQLIIQVNGLNMKARRNQVRLSDKKIVNKATTSVKIRQEVPRTAHLECNLIGMRVDEALETMDKFLDDARLANLKSVRIIHGDGTGALRKAVHQKLKGDHTIDSFRLGTPSEGSTGATVVVFKG
ncbi:MAG: Smr/MutS family protein, partial [Erysipelotrichaceae bacterium]|nr:Smr/MutS family protein [Erysipelotrichaceae bacterium]